MFTYLIKGESPQFLAIDQQLQQSAHIIVVDDNHQVAGYVTQHNNRYHPYHTTLDITCLWHTNKPPFYNAVIQYLCTRFDKMKISCYSSEQIDLVTALLQHGFLKKRRCFESRVSIKRVNYYVFEGYALNAFDPQTCPPLLKQCIVDDYKNTHQSVSPLNQDISAEELFHTMTAESHSSWSFYKLFNGKMVYFICEKIDDDTCYITYVGGNVDLQTLYEFYQQCLFALIKKGVKSLDYEIDDINEKQMLLGEIFPLTSRSWDTYIYERKADHN